MHKSIALLMLTVLLPACGLKGDLYLPQQKPVTSPPAAPAPDAQSDDKKKPASVAK